jgi:hypothetical protein
MPNSLTLGQAKQLLIAPVIGMLIIGIPAFVLSSAPTSPLGQLERGSWTVTLEPTPEAASKGLTWFVDTMVFKRGKLDVTGQRTRGFGPAPYELTPLGAGWSMTARQESVTHGEVLWTGELSGGMLAGLMVWTKPDGTRADFSFRAELSP